MTSSGPGSISARGLPLVTWVDSSGRRALTRITGDIVVDMVDFSESPSLSLPVPLSTSGGVLSIIIGVWVEEALRDLRAAP